MAGCSEDHVLILHQDDSRDWAKFLLTRLSDSRYGIHCVLKHITDPPTRAPPPPPPRPHSSKSLSSSSRGTSTKGGAGASNNDENLDTSDDEIYMNHAGSEACDTNNNQNGRNSSVKRNTSSRSSSIKTNNPMSTPEKGSLEESISKSKATVVFLSPDIVQGDTPLPVDVRSLTPKTSVFLLLGVEIEEARTFFGKNSDHAFKCRIGVIDGTEETICDALIQIIQAYEYNSTSSEEDEEGGLADDIYQIAPSPVQANKVDKVFPQTLSGDEREVYVLLTLPAEDSVLVVLEDMAQELALTQICDRLYSFTLPKTCQGKVSFRVECSGRTVGEASVQASTALDVLRDILTREVTPLTLLASALGLPPGDVGGVDTALAFKLQELASAVTFAKMFPCEEALGNNTTAGEHCGEGVKDDRSSLMWPSLLHFAADLNLRTLCSELLRYPGMLAAALTENREGLYPCQMAAKKGFTLLEQTLLKFVEAHKTECYDSDGSDYVLPTPLVPPTSPHASRQNDYMNDGQVYVQMDGPSPRNTFLDLQPQKSDTVGRSVSHVSQQSSDSVFTSHSSQEDESNEDLYINVDDLQPSTLLPTKSGEPSVPTSSTPDKPRGVSAATSLGDSPTSSKALKMLGVQEHDIARSRATTVSQLYDIDILPYLAAYPPGMRIPNNQMHARAGSNESVSSNCDNPEQYLTRKENKPPVIRDKLKSFFSKIKGGSSKRNNSEGDISAGGTLKKCSSIISQQSAQSTRSDSKLSSSKKSKSFSYDEQQERDSGSYSDEEKAKASSSMRKTKQRVFKESDKAMDRRLSKRVQQAKSERISNAPSLPPREKQKRRGAFKSHIETEDNAL